MSKRTLHTIYPNKRRSYHHGPQTNRLRQCNHKANNPHWTQLNLYLQILIFTNQSLQSILILHIYMLKHNEDLNLIPLIHQTIEIIVNKYPTYFPILAGDFR